MSDQIAAFLASGNNDVLQLPALRPPPGVFPNFEDPSSRGPVLIIVNGVLLGLMTVFIAVRIYTKLCLIQKASWDDLTVSLSVLGVLWLYVNHVWGKSLLSPLKFPVRLLKSCRDRTGTIGYTPMELTFG